MKSLYSTRAAARRMAIIFVCAFQLTTNLSADNYYWVNGSGNWSAYATHWAKIPNPTLPAHYHANIPTDTSDVYFGDTNGGTAYTVNVDAGFTVPKCRNMDWTGVPAGTVWGGGGGRMDIYGALTMDANLTMTFNNGIHFISNDAAVKQIWSKTVHFSSGLFFEGTDGGWQFMDELYCESSIYHWGGFLNTNGQKVTVIGDFRGNYQGPTDGQLHLSSSEFNIGSYGYFNYSPGQFDAGTSHIKFLGANVGLVGPINFATPINFYNVSFLQVCTSGGFSWGNIDGTLTFHQFGRIYSHSLGGIPVLKNVIFLEDGWIANATNYMNLTFTAGKTYTVENHAFGTGTDQTILPGGSLTALGAGTCSQFITIKSWQYGTHFNLVNNSGAKQTVHCAILEDCHATGSDPLEVLDGVDLGNNTGWIFTDPNPGLNLYWVGGAGDWNDPCHWTDDPLSLVGDCGCIPNGGSNVHFTANSGFSPGDVVTVSVDAYCANMDWTGVTGEPEFYHVYGGVTNLHIYGSVTLATDMNFNFGGKVRFRTSDTATITSVGQDFDFVVILEGTGVWELQDTFKVPNYEVIHERGIFKTLGHPMLINRWLGSILEDNWPTRINMGAELWLGETGGNSSTVWFVKSTKTNQKGHFWCWYEAGKFHAVESHIIGEKGGYIHCHPATPHDFWDVTFLPIDHAGDFLYGNILNKLTFLAFGNLAGPNTHIHEVEFHKGAYLFDSHTYDILTIHGGHNFKFQPYTHTGSTVQTITAGGVFNYIDTGCENPTVMHNPTPGETTTFRKEGAGTAFDIQHTIFDRVYADQTSGAIYTATNCVAIQPDVEASWNMTNPAPRDLYWVGGAGDWHSAAHWSLASGGAGGECPPTAHDNVFFNAAAGLSAGDAVTTSEKFSFCKDMDWTGVGNGAVFDNTLTFATNDPYALNNLNIFGNLTFSSSMVNNFISPVWLRANGPATITSAGQQFKNTIYFWNPDGSWTLMDDLSMASLASRVNAVVHSYGSLNTNDKNVLVGGWNYDNGNSVTTSASAILTLGSSKLKISNLLYGNVGAFGFFYYSPGQFSCGTSEITFEAAAYTRLFAPGYTTEFYDVIFKTSQAYFENGTVKNKLLFEKDGGMSQYAGGDYSIHDLEFLDDGYFSTAYGTSSRDVHSIKFAPGKRYTFANNFTLNLVPHNGVEGQFIAQGLPGQYIEMKSSDPNTPAIIHKDDYDGTSTCTKYLFLTGMTHTGTEDIYVPTPGGDVFNNAGWQFFPCNPCPATIPVLDVANSITTGCPPGQAKLVLAGLKPDEWAIWYSDPAATTNIVYNGGQVGPMGNMFMPVITGPVTYYARVYSDGGLCESTVVLSVDITITSPPAAFNVTGGGLVCSGSNGTPVGLAGSVAGVSYQLQLDGSDTGSPLAGTGATLDFGLQTAAGTYTVVATTDGTACPAVMTGSAVVTGSVTQAPAVIAGSNSPVYSTATPLQLTESGGEAVSWSWTGPGGFASTDQNPVINNPTSANSGAYTVVVTGANGCSNAAVVQVLVSPLAIVCPGDVLVTLGSGECGAVVNYPPSFVTGGAGGGSVMLTSGLPSGSEFPIGTTTNCYLVTDAQNNMADCCFDVTVEEYPNPIASLTCNDLVYISLAPPACQFTIGAEHILDGGPYHCYDDYIVEMDITPPFGNGPWVPAVIGVADIGMTYQIRVTDPDTGNKCWGNVLVQDVLPPQMQCSDIMVDCGPPPVVPPLVTDCQTYTLSSMDQVVQNTPPTTPYQIITRTWTATDAGGISAVCTQTITVQYAQPATQNTCTATACEGTFGSGLASFDLTDEEQCITQGAAGVSVRYFTDAALMNEIFNPLAFVSGATTVYSLVTTISTGCTSSGTLALLVTPLPNAGNISGSSSICANEGNLFTTSGVSGGVWGSDDPGVAMADANTGFVYGVAPGNCNILYFVTVNGCSNFTDFPLEVRPLPQVIGISNSPVCAGGDINLNEIGGEALDWTWLGPNGFYVPGTQNLIIPNATPGMNGIYTVAGLGPNGCWAYSDVLVVVTASPPPVLDPASVLVVQQGQQATLILQNLPPGYEAVWYAADQTTVLYADAANLFQPVMNQGMVFYGAVREIGSGCLSALLEVKVRAYAPLSIRVENCAVTCADGSDGMATAIVRGGEQSKGTGNFVLSDDRYGFSGLKTTTADFDGDGTLDIYATSGIAGSVYHDQVWLNRGDGTFEYQFVEYNSTKTGWRPVSGDLDGDGDTDVVVISGSSTLIMLNNGAGYFSETTLAGLGGFGVDLADLDNDQDLDVILGGIGHCYVFYNDGNANFTQHPTNYASTNTVVISIQTGDLNNDGWMDAWLAAGNWNGLAGIPDIVLINDQTGVLTVSPESYGNFYSVDVALGDLNGDQYLDAFVATYFNAPDKVYLNDGDGTFTEAVQGYSNYSTDAVVLADFDADGDLDAATSFAGTTAPIGLEIWVNDGVGVFTRYPEEFPNGNDLAAGDFDQDGDIDLFVTNQGSTTGHYVLLNDNRAVVPYTYQWDAGTGSQTTAVATGLSAGSYNVTVTDAAGTAIVATAVITANPSISLSTTNTDASCATAMDGTASVMATGGAPFSFVVGGSVPANSVVGPPLALGDLNGDGQKDVVFLDDTGYKVALQNGGDGFDVQPQVLTTDGRDVVLVDLDNDGDLDAVIAGYFIRVFHNDGSGNLTEVPESYTLCGQVTHCYANGIDAGDLDGDGDIDLFVVNGLNGPCTVWLNDGDGTFTESAERYGSEDGRDIQLGDLDGDGDLDAFVANQGHPDVVYLNDGDGTFTRSPESYSNLVSASVDLGDLDGDGDLDAFVGTDLGQNDRMLLNNGDGTFILTPEQLKSTNNSDVELADLDGDGDLDVYTTLSIIPGETCKVWLNNGNGTFAELPQEFPRAAFIQFDDLDGDSDLDAIYTFRGNLFWAFNVQNFTYLWSTGATTETITGLSPGPYTVIVTDASGCTAEEMVVVGNLGNTPPALASSNSPFCTGSGPLQLFESGGAQGVTWAWSGPGGFQSTAQNPVIANPTPAKSGVYTVVVTDANGCTNSSDVQVEIKPRPAAAISGDDEVCENETLILNETGGEGVSWEWYNASGLIATTQTLTDPNPTNAQYGGYAVVIVTGANGCTNSLTVDVIVYDAPVAVCPPDITICTSELPLDLSTLGALQVGGTFSGPGVTGGWFDAAPGATYQVTYTVTNADNCTEYCLFDITVTASPVVTCPPNSSTCLAAGSMVLSGGAPAGGTYSGPGVNAGVFDPATAGVGQHTITYSYTNGQNCTDYCSFSIEVVAGQLPAITCPGPVTVLCAGNIPAPDPGLVGLSGGCGAASVAHLFTTAPYDVDCANRFSVTRYYQATDASNNTVSCSQVITVFDDEKPNFTFVPANVTVQCNSLPAPGSPTATDNCGGAVGIAYNGQTRANGGCTDSYTLTRQWTATDACGNTRTATQRISVIDTQKPEFVSPPANITVQCDAIPQAAAPTATDNCDTNVGITYVGQTRTNGACANAYTLTRRWVASDNCNNTRSISQRITVVDNGKPTLTIPPDQIIACNATIPPVGTATATDGCGGTVNILYLGQTTANTTCPGNYQLRRTWRATDVCGNSTVATQTIQVADNQPPIFTSVPVGTTIQCTQAPPALSNPVATDNCGGFVNITYLGQVRTDGSCLYNYTLTRTWRATDLCGNAATTVQVITVQDTAPPVFSNIPASVTVACAPNCVPPPAPPTATDNCGSAGLTMLETQSPGDCATGYTVTRTWTATDQCGNPSTCAQTFTVLPTPFAQTEDRSALKTQNPTLKTVTLLPNPTTDRVWIDLGDFAGETVLVFIQNDLGQRIWERRVDAVPDLQLPVNLRAAGAAAGLYTVSVRSGGQVVSGRLVLVE